MESKTFELDATEKSRKTIIDNEVFKKVVVKNFWDAHGKEIPWEDDTGKTSHTFTNAKVLLEKVTRVYHFEYTGDSEFETYELTVNDKKYTGDIVSCKGNVDRLVIKACIGAG